jgi:hypothetical protein
MLNTCVNLKSMHADNLLKALSHDLNINQNFDKHKIERLCMDNSQIYLNNEIMSAVAYKLPNLKVLHINAFGSYQILSYLNSFEFISELIICNTNVLAYKLDGYLRDFLKNHGKKLKFLHLVHLPDINVKYLMKQCFNLFKLILEFVHYYEPCNDDDQTKSDDMKLNNLSYLHVGNFNTSSASPYVNVDQFKAELLMLIGKAPSIKYLKLESLSFVDNAFFKDLYNFNLSKTIEFVELKELNNLHIDTGFIEDFLFDWKNNLSKINFIDCKQMTKCQHLKIVKAFSILNCNCEVTWR